MRERRRSYAREYRRQMGELVRAGRIPGDLAMEFVRTPRTAVVSHPSQSEGDTVRLPWKTAPPPTGGIPPRTISVPTTSCAHRTQSRTTFGGNSLSTESRRIYPYRRLAQPHTGESLQLSYEVGVSPVSITSAISQLRADCAVKDISLVVGCGPTLLTDLTDDLVAGRSTSPLCIRAVKTEGRCRRTIAHSTTI